VVSKYNTDQLVEILCKGIQLVSCKTRDRLRDTRASLGVGTHDFFFHALLLGFFIWLFKLRDVSV
jgi:hypothetical protein